MTDFPAPRRTAIAASPDNYYRGRTSAIRCVVVHDGETDEGATAAEGMGNWFANPRAGGSTNKGTDPDSICTYMSDADTPWGAPGVNSDGLHVEQAGRAGQSASQWADSASLRTIENAAIVGAEWSLAHGIPPRWLTDAQIRDRRTRGFLTHRDATRAFGTAGGHTDPGPNYPRDYYMSRVRHHVARIAGAGEDDMTLAEVEEAAFKGTTRALLSFKVHNPLDPKGGFIGLVQWIRVGLARRADVGYARDQLLVQFDEVDAELAKLNPAGVRDAPTVTGDRP